MKYVDISQGCRVLGIFEDNRRASGGFHDPVPLDAPITRQTWQKNIIYT